MHTTSVKNRDGELSETITDLDSQDVGGVNKFGEPPDVRVAAQPGRPTFLARLFDRTPVTRASKRLTRCPKMDTPNDPFGDPTPNKLMIRSFQQVPRGTTQNIPLEYVEASRPKRRGQTPYPAENI
jgi:hypothetical protein